MQPAHIQWRDGRPHATDFDDIYFSADGVHETLRVFIEPSGILQRAARHSQVCVAELGFGTGLNFAVLAQEILTRTPARLHFISFEKFPLRGADWQQVFARRAQDFPIYADLEQQAPPLLPGWHQRVLADGRIVLNVFHGDAADGLADLSARQRNPIDAWFLDGFAPDRNPDMWSPQLCQSIAATAHANTTVATFSAAGRVRRNLQAAGFNMRKVDQRPFKRESLAGAFNITPARQAAARPERVVIHGAGMAGAYTARHLAEQGIAVQVYDPNGIANGASSMAATVLHSRLLGDGSPGAELRSSAFHYASTYLRRFDGFTPTGVIRMQGPSLNEKKLQRICQSFDTDNSDQQQWIQRVNAEDAAAICGAPIAGDALYHPGAGTVDAPALCAEMLAHDNIEYVHRTSTFDPGAINILCAASAVRRFPGCELLEITDVYGQLDWYASTTEIARTPVVGNGYLVPTPEGCALGATYEYTPWAAEDATAHNLELNRHLVAHHNLTWLRRGRGARCVASDRTPVVGTFETDENGHRVWLCTALGSMGNTAGVLAAAIISADILGWAAPVSPAVAHLMRPQRFAERQARRGIRHIEPPEG